MYAKFKDAHEMTMYRTHVMVPSGSKLIFRFKSRDGRTSIRAFRNITGTYTLYQKSWVDGVFYGSVKIVGRSKVEEMIALFSELAKEYSEVFSYRKFNGYYEYGFGKGE